MGVGDPVEHDHNCVIGRRRFGADIVQRDFFQRGGQQGDALMDGIARQNRVDVVPFDDFEGRHVDFAGQFGQFIGDFFRR